MKNETKTLHTDKMKKQFLQILLSVIKANENKHFLNAEGLQMKCTSHPYLHQTPLPERTAFDQSVHASSSLLTTLSESSWHPDMKGDAFRSFISPHSFLYQYFC